MAFTTAFAQIVADIRRLFRHPILTINEKCRNENACYNVQVLFFCIPAMIFFKQFV